MEELERVEGLAVFNLLSDIVQHIFDDLGSLVQEALRPIVACSVLGRYEVIRVEKRAQIFVVSDRIENSRFKVNQYSSRYAPAGIQLLIEYIELLSLHIVVRFTNPIMGVDGVLLGDRAPELFVNLVTSLSNRQSNDFSHLFVYLNNLIVFKKEISSTCILSGD